MMPSALVRATEGVVGTPLLTATCAQSATTLRPRDSRLAAVDDNEIRVLARLLLPHRDQIEAIWGRHRPKPRFESNGPTDLLTLPQAAEILGVKSTSTVYRLISTGDLTAVDIGGKGSTRAKTRIRRDHLQQFIEGRTRRAPERGRAL